MKYLVSGYWLVPMIAEIVIEADTPAQAMKMAKAEWAQDRRRLLVPGSDDEGSACDWRPTAGAAGKLSKENNDRALLGNTGRHVS